MLIGNTTKTILRLKVVLLQETLNYLYVQILKIKHDFIYFSFMFVLTDKSIDAELLISLFRRLYGTSLFECVNKVKKGAVITTICRFDTRTVCLKFVFDWIKYMCKFCASCLQESRRMPATNDSRTNNTVTN